METEAAPLLLLIGVCLTSAIEFVLFCLNRTVWKTAQTLGVPSAAAGAEMLPRFHGTMVWVTRAVNYLLLWRIASVLSWKVAVGVFAAQCLALLALPIPYNLCLTYLEGVKRRRQYGRSGGNSVAVVSLVLFGLLVGLNSCIRVASLHTQGRSTGIVVHFIRSLWGR